MPKEESILQKSIMQLLAAHKIPAVKHNPFGGFNKDGSLRRSGQRGEPDISAVIPPYGKALKIEVKSPKGKLTLEQAVRLKEYAEAGCLVVIARTLLDVELNINNFSDDHCMGTHEPYLWFERNPIWCLKTHWQEIQDTIARGK